MYFRDSLLKQIKATIMDSPDLDKVVTQTWRSKRSVTVRSFCIISAFLGMEYSIIFTTLWLYLKNVVKTTQPILFYSLISSSYYVSSIVVSLIASRVVDRSRNVRSTFIACTILGVIGNTLYCLPYSPALLLCGRFIAGISCVMRPIMTGEVARVYWKEEEKIQTISLITLFYNVGFIIGPGINFFFLKINFTVGSWNINHLNSPVLFMNVLFVSLLALELFAVHNLSKEFDCKAYLERRKASVEPGSEIEGNEMSSLLLEEGEENQESLVKADQTSPNDIDMKKASTVGDGAQSTLQLLLKVDIIILLVCSGLFVFVANTFDMWLSLLVIEVIGWHVTEVSIITIAAGALATLYVVLIYEFACTPRKLLIVSMVGIFSNCIMNGIIILLKLYHDNKVLNILNFCLYAIFFGLILIPEEVMFAATLAKKVPSQIQSYAESVRQAFTTSATLISLLVSPYLFDLLVETSSVLIICCAISFVAIYLRRKQFLL